MLVNAVCYLLWEHLKSSKLCIVILHITCIYDSTDGSPFSWHARSMDLWVAIKAALRDHGFKALPEPCKHHHMSTFAPSDLHIYIQQCINSQSWLDFNFIAVRTQHKTYTIIINPQRLKRAELHIVGQYSFLLHVIQWAKWMHLHTWL